MKIKDANDARETLRIANMAYAAGAYQEAFDMLDALSAYVTYSQDEIPEDERYELQQATLSAVCQFHSCPNECLWEMSGNLRDRFD